MRKFILTLSVSSILICLTTRQSIAQTTPGELNIMTYNVLYGFNHGTYKNETANWISEKEPDILALQELKNYNAASLQNLALEWKHNYTHIYDRPGAVQPIALSSNAPISEIKEIEKEKSHRGFLIAKTHDIYFVVVHLHPNNMKKRIEETAFILKHIDSLKQYKKEVVVLGDFNAMSPYDKSYADTNLKKRLLQRIAQEKCADLAPKCADWDYTVMQKYLDSGLIDVSYTKLTDKNNMIATREYGTFPSLAAIKITNPETRKQNLHRLDYILMTPDLASNVKSTVIYKSPENEKLSDHYPVMVQLKY